LNAVQSCNENISPLLELGSHLFDAITELWFRDEAAIQEMNRITSDEAVGRLFYEDELKFFDRAACRIVTCEEIVDPQRGSGNRASPALESN